MLSPPLPPPPAPGTGDCPVSSRPVPFPPPQLCRGLFALAGGLPGITRPTPSGCGHGAGAARHPAGPRPATSPAPWLCLGRPIGGGGGTGTGTGTGPVHPAAASTPPRGFPTRFRTRRVFPSRQLSSCSVLQAELFPTASRDAKIPDPGPKKTPGRLPCCSLPLVPARAAGRSPPGTTVLSPFGLSAWPAFGTPRPLCCRSSDLVTPAPVSEVQMYM